jgi:hypothetical protein
MMNVAQSELKEIPAAAPMGGDGDFKWLGASYRKKRKTVMTIPPITKLTTKALVPAPIPPEPSEESPKPIATIATIVMASALNA